MASVEQVQSAEQTPASEGDAHGAGSANGAPDAPATGAIPVENPATGEIVATVADLDRDAVKAIAARARAAQPGWEAYGFEGRARIMLRAQKWLMDNADRVIATIVSETGKTFEDASLAEISYAANAFGFWAKHAGEYLADERVKSSQLLVKGKKLIVRYRPLGVIGVIGPWNYPLTNSFGDCIPALMAGNSVILKPSEITPLTSLLMAEGLRECGLPEDVFQVATGRGATGAALIEEVDMIMFTGSTRTGRKVAEAAARRLIPASLELGGKDPMIVLSDADLERAANFATYYSMQNAGQTCISIERVYVEEPVYDEFVEKVSEKVRALRVGKPEGPGSVEVGAITFPPQLETIEEHVTDAVDKGARVLAGGQQPPSSGGGRFFEPTVLVDVDHTMKMHDRGDVRADAADHEGRGRRRGGAPGQRLAVRPRLVGVHARHRARRADRAADRRRRGERQRRDDQLHRARAADGRRQGVRPRLAPRRRRHPQVLLPAGDRRHAEARAQEGTAHVPVQESHVAPARRRLQVPVRSRQEGLTAGYVEHGLAKRSSAARARAGVISAARLIDAGRSARVRIHPTRG